MKSVRPLLSGIAFSALVITGAVAGEGKVVSAINTDMYSYVEVNQGERNLWIAGPKVSLNPGDAIRFPDGMMMQNFHSKQLQRTFPSVMFVQQIVVAGEGK